MNGLGGNAQKDLQQRIERIERLEEQKAAIASDIKSEYKSADSSGLDVKAMRAIVKMRKKDPAELENERAITNLYARTLGLIAELSGA